LAQIEERSGVRIDTCSSHPSLSMKQKPAPGKSDEPKKYIAKIKTGPR